MVVLSELAADSGHGSVGLLVVFVVDLVPRLFAEGNGDERLGDCMIVGVAAE